jgi:hypothetical protein
MKNSITQPVSPVNRLNLVSKITERKNSHDLCFITQDLIRQAEIVRNKAVKLCEK